MATTEMIEVKERNPVEAVMEPQVAIINLGHDQDESQIDIIEKFVWEYLAADGDDFISKYHVKSSYETAAIKFLLFEGLLVEDDISYRKRLVE